MIYDYSYKFLHGRTIQYLLVTAINLLRKSYNLQFVVVGGDVVVVDVDDD